MQLSVLLIEAGDHFLLPLHMCPTSYNLGILQAAETEGLFQVASIWEFPRNWDYRVFYVRVLVRAYHDLQFLSVILVKNRGYKL